jgi:hypothetical protein
MLCNTFRCDVRVLECEQARRNVKACSMRWNLLSVARVDRTWFGLAVLLAGGLGIALMVGASFAYGQSAAPEESRDLSQTPSDQTIPFEQPQSPAAKAAAAEAMNIRLDHGEDSVPVGRKAELSR